MITTDFQRLPISIQHRIYVLATYNPFRKTKEVTKFAQPYSVVEIRETPVVANVYYRIHASWEAEIVCLGKIENPKLNFMYVLEYSNNNDTDLMGKSIMVYRDGVLEIKDPSFTEYIHELIEAYKTRDLIVLD